jgi:hypothetical protein
MKFYVAGPGLTYTDTNGVQQHFAPHGTVLDAANPVQAFPANFVPPPDAYTLWPMDAAAQTAIQNAIAARAAMAPQPPGGGATIPGLPDGLPVSVPIWVP